MAGLLDHSLVAPFPSACYRPAMRFVTDFFDAAVVLPVVLVFAIGVALQGRGRRAVFFLAAVAGTLAVVAATKFALAACASPGAWFHSPSGHVASAAILAGGVSAVLSARRPMVAAASAAALVGLTRYVLDEHTLPDIAAGAAVGLSFVAALIRRLARDPMRPLWPVLLPCAIAVAVTHGQHLRAEAAIRDAATSLHCR